MKIYSPTGEEKLAVYRHLNSHNDIIVELEAEINWCLNEYDDAVEENDEDWKRRCIFGAERANKTLKAYYKAALIIEKAYAQG